MTTGLLLCFLAIVALKQITDTTAAFVFCAEVTARVNFQADAKTTAHFQLLNLNL